MFLHGEFEVSLEPRRPQSQKPQEVKSGIKGRGGTGEREENGKQKLREQEGEEEEGEGEEGHKGHSGAGHGKVWAKEQLCSELGCNLWQAHSACQHLYLGMRAVIVFSRGEGFKSRVSLAV